MLIKHREAFFFWNSSAQAHMDKMRHFSITKLIIKSPPADLLLGLKWQGEIIRSSGRLHSRRDQANPGTYLCLREEEWASQVTHDLQETV